MNKIKIFDPDIGKSGEYIDHVQCESCDRIYKNPDSVWCCTTCKQNVCENCKNSIHENHNTLKSEYTICQAHDSDCSCSACNPDLYGFYYPTADKTEINITMSEDLILLQEGDYNPDMLMAKIPLLIEENSDKTITLSFDPQDIAKKIINEYNNNKLYIDVGNKGNIWGAAISPSQKLYVNNNLSYKIEDKLKNKDHSSITLFPDGTII